MYGTTSYNQSYVLASRRDYASCLSHVFYTISSGLSKSELRSLIYINTII